MSFQETGNVIHKKARTARADHDARAMSPAKALRLSLERACDRLYGLALNVCAVEQRRIGLDDLKQEIGDDTLLLLLEARDMPPGVAVLDHALVQALVEVQTMGRVLSSTAPARAFTDTDAAIGAPLLDAVLAGFEEKLAEDHGPRQTPAYRFGGRVADSRALMLEIEEPVHELFRLTCDIARGALTGTLTLILTEDAAAPPRPEPPPGGQGGDFDLSELVMTAPATLDAVLGRLTLPLSRVMRLAPGMTLTVDATAIGRTELVAAHGHVAAFARLGQMNGFRAVRLTGMSEAAAPAGSEAPGAAPDGPPDPPRPVAPPGQAAPAAGEGLPNPAGLSEPPDMAALADTSEKPAMPGPATARGEDETALPDLADLPALGHL